MAAGAIPQARHRLRPRRLAIVNSGRVRLLNNRRLVAQLIGLERRTSRAGRDSIDRAPSAHDDLANSAAGALVLALAKKPQTRVGTIDFAKTGKVTGKDDESQRQRIRFVTVTEQEAIKEKMT